MLLAVLNLLPVAALPVTQLANAVNHLHSNRIVHMDICPANFTYFT